MNARNIFPIFVLTVALVTLVACGPAAPPPTPITIPTIVVPTIVIPTINVPTIVIPTIVIPATPTPVPTAVPATTAPTPTTAPSESGSTLVTYDGEWEGTTSTDSIFAFTVQDDAADYININFFVDSGSCQGLSGAYATSVDSAPIQNDGFTFTLTDDDGGTVDVTGKFTSPTEANGTFEMKRSASFCGEYELPGTWTATRLAAAPEATAESAETPTDEPATEETPTAISGAETLETFFDAINSGEFDAAAELLTDDVILNSGTSVLVGRQEVMDYFLSRIAADVQFTVTDVTDLGGLVTFTLIATDGGSPNANAAITDGKIELFNLLP